MSVHYTHRQSYVPPIKQPHASEQWRDRTPAEVSVEEAWKAGVPVEAPECNAQDVRLYSPYDALLVLRAGLLRTVLLGTRRTDLSELAPCTECGDLVHSILSARCPWCDAVLDEVTSGRVTLRREGVQ